MPTDKEKLEEIRRMGDEASKKVQKIIKKKIDPIYSEILGKIEEGLGKDKYLPWAMEMLLTPEQAQIMK